MMLDLEGRTFGPSPLHLTADRVHDFTSVTGDDLDRWSEAAPPGMASAALFVVAPGLLRELTGHSVIHGEQTFSWHRPLEVGAALEVIGTVRRVRERGGVQYIGFDMEAGDGDGTVVAGSSLFLVTGETLPADSNFERPEPPHSYRGDAEPGQFSASRADLVRYAAATGDWNPIHWDHEAAIAAGLPGVVVHGLLQCAWALNQTSKASRGDAPFASAKVRFRNPLLPARPVSIDVADREGSYSISVFDVDNEYLSAMVEPANG